MKLSEFISAGNLIFKKYLDSSKLLYSTFGIILEDIETLNDELYFTICPNLVTQSYNSVVHGGVVMTFLDIAAGILALAHASEYHSKIALTINFECSFKKKMLVGQEYVVNASILNFIDDEMNIIAAISQNTESKKVIIAEAKGFFKLK